MYTVVAGTYIVLSSTLAARVAVTVAALKSFEVLKGSIFVAVTALALFWVSRAAYRRLEKSTDTLLKQERLMLINERRMFAGLMASSVAHDANNVLITVMADLSDIAESPAVDHAAVGRLQAAVSQLIDMNRRLVQVTHPHTPADHHPIDLTAVVKEAIDFCRKHPSLRHKKLEFSGDRVTVEGQSLLLSQLTTNLVINAGEATLAKGLIEVRISAEGGVARLEVHDNGPGVPVERRQNLFSALTTTKASGNGMGLFSVKACVAALGGSVEVTDSPLGGACFRVQLPVSQRSHATVAVAHAPLAANDPSFARAR